MNVDLGGRVSWYSFKTLCEKKIESRTWYKSLAIILAVCQCDRELVLGTCRRSWNFLCYASCGIGLESNRIRNRSISSCIMKIMKWHGTFHRQLIFECGGYRSGKRSCEERSEKATLPVAYFGRDFIGGLGELPGVVPELQRLVVENDSGWEQKRNIYQICELCASFTFKNIFKLFLIILLVSSTFGCGELLCKF